MISADIDTDEIGQPNWLQPSGITGDLQPLHRQSKFAERVADDHVLIASHTRFERLDEYSDGTRVVTRTERSIYRAVRNHPQSNVAARIAGARADPLRLLRKMGLFAGGIVAVASAGYAMLPSREQVRPSPPLTITLPPPATVAPRHDFAERRSKTGTQATKHPTGATPVASLVLRPATDPSAAADLGSEDIATSVDAALARGFATDEPQPWQNANAGGMVVVGPAQSSGRNSCRDVAVLTRAPGQPDQTINNRRCIATDGTIRVVG